MKHVHTRHARCTALASDSFDDDDYAYADGFYARRNLEAFNRASHPDALREMHLEPAEHIQADPLTIIRSIERAEMLWAIGIVTACVVIAGALNIIGGNA